MSLLTLDQVSLHLGGKAILDDVSLRVATHDRIGLVGPNGSGKTTLLRLIVGEQTPDGGAIHRQRRMRVGYLPQELVAVEDVGILRYVVESVPGRTALDEQLCAAEQELADAEQVEVSQTVREELLLELAGQIAELHDRIAHFEEHYSEHHAKRILTGLGFEPADFDRQLHELSGGWRMRAVLAALLFQRPDVLLLDEPTNHLDMPSVAWLSSFMQTYPGAFVLISHDRDFLNEQIHRVVSFEVEGLRTYAGNYDQYERQRREELTVLEARKKNLERERQHMQQFVDRFRAKASKASQVQSRVKALEKMETIDLPSERKKIRFRFPTCERTGREVLQASGIEKSFGDNVVLSGIDLSLMRGEKVAILGKNGAGKTTLLRILAGELEPDKGTVTIGHRVKLGYYAQHHVDVLDPKATAFAEVDRVDREGNSRSALGAMQFSGDDIDKKIGVLSGGERARVALARLLVDPGNALLMDEPTNHLDLDSSERLAEALREYEGTLLFVSHNRGFVRRLATRIWHVQDARVEVYPGTFDEYLYSMQQRGNEGEEPPPGPSNSAEVNRSRAAMKEKKRREAERRQQIAPLRKRLAALEDQIATLESDKTSREQSLADPALYEDAVARDEALHAFHVAKQQLESVTEEWLSVQEQLDSLLSEDT